MLISEKKSKRGIEWQMGYPSTNHHFTYKWNRFNKTRTKVQMNGLYHHAANHPNFPFLIDLDHQSSYQIYLEECLLLKN